MVVKQPKDQQFSTLQVDCWQSQLCEFGHKQAQMRLRLQNLVQNRQKCSDAIIIINSCQIYRLQQQQVQIEMNENMVLNVLTRHRSETKYASNKAKTARNSAKQPELNKNSYNAKTAINPAKSPELKETRFKAKQLLKDKVSEPIDQNVDIRLQTIDQKVFQITLKEFLTIKAVKNIIFQRYSQQLEADLMALTYQDRPLSEGLHLYELNNKKPTVKQTKAKLEDIPNLPYRNSQCPFTGENGTVELLCEHRVGRKALGDYVTRRLDYGFSTVDCPFYSLTKTVQCKKGLDFLFLTRVLSSTATEASIISQRLSDNYVTNDGHQPDLGTMPSMFSWSVSFNDYLIRVITANYETVQLRLRNDCPIRVIKQIIFDNHCQSLGVDQMSLTYKGKVLEEGSMISALKNNEIFLEQIKADPSIALGIPYFDEECQISLERGVFQLHQCQHKVSKGTMQEYVKKLLSDGSNIINCPHAASSEEAKCKKALDFQFVTKLLGYTLQESNNLSQALSINLYNPGKHKKCPKCKLLIIKLNLKTNRVKCGACGHGDFCYECLSPWKTSSSNCISSVCDGIAQYIEKSPCVRIFKLTDPKTKIQKEYFTPQVRACPTCKGLIEHAKDCKHMTCPKCSKPFCWVCLNLKDKNDNWPCGSYSQFCGRIAPNQKLRSV